jgi:hypothetical protein
MIVPPPFDVGSGRIASLVALFGGDVKNTKSIQPPRLNANIVRSITVVNRDIVKLSMPWKGLTIESLARVTGTHLVS